MSLQPKMSISKALEAVDSTDQVSKILIRPNFCLDKSFENQSNLSGGKRSDKNVTVNFAIGGYGG